MNELFNQLISQSIKFIKSMNTRINIKPNSFDAFAKIEINQTTNQEIQIIQ